MICAHNYVHNFDFVPCICSWPHDKDCLYILLSSENSLSPLQLTETIHSLSHFHLQRQHTLSLLHFDFQQSTPWKCIHSVTFFFLVQPFRLDFFQPWTQPRKFCQTLKETNNQHGRRHVPPRTHCFISIYWYLSPHTFYNQQDTFNI